MGYIITCRNPRTKTLVIVMTDEDDPNPAEFNTEDEAHMAAHNTTICKAWGYEVIEV
jgi:hypothetical protein